MSAKEKPQSSAMHRGPGFRIRKEIPRPSVELTDAFRPFEGAMISDLQNRLYTMRPAIQSMTSAEHLPLVGPACTVRCFPGDNLMVHAALDVAKPGDIVVIDAGGSYMNAVLGDLISTKAKHRGIAGFVIDGLIRDLEGIEKVGMPVFARGVTPTGPLHRGPGEINYPIQSGGIVVNPGDIIFGDACGVVVIRQEIAPELLGRCQEKTAREEEYVASVQRGDFSNEWVWRSLDGCQLDGEESNE
jgi:RraA family protein